ncbi:MAP kinase kinase kinase kinase activity protein [Marasmius sp. AFHP31]|nr:MAP kinase kinase kinase kinase activity protein [Marasmius sp. AFHP31]
MSRYPHKPALLTSNSILFSNVIHELAVDRLLRSSSHPLAPYMRDLATIPSLPSMTVIHPQLPWPITVHPSNQSDEGVTIADVLLSIGRLMREKDEGGWGGTPGVEKLSYLDGKQKLIGFIKGGPDGDVWEMYMQ